MTTTSGRALIGFMPKDQAVHYLSTECEPGTSTPSALRDEWLSAVGILGKPAPNAGLPTIRDIPQSKKNHVHALCHSPDWGPLFSKNPHWELKLIEAEPLIAHQFSVQDAAAWSYLAGFSTPPTLDELLAACLPLLPINQELKVSLQGNAAMIRSHSLNVRPLTFGMVSGNCIQLIVGSPMPFVRVHRFRGRCYLVDGYHRVYAAMKAGAREVPVLIFDVASEAEISLNPPATFPLSLLESSNPPTMRHFGDAYSHPVNLIVKEKIIHLSWTDWVTHAN